MNSDDLKTSARNAGERGTAAAHDIEISAEERGSAAADQAQTLAGQVGGAANELYDRARNRVQDIADRAPGSASDAYAAGRRVYAQGSDRLGQQVARQPIEALLLAGAIGYLVGWATGRS